ncbi:vancomycin B-type resistance protein VanW [Lachnospiraceae bacterium KM106-2]|nr:vancomycin B-type resistance protein VanW [Lachnospiraceae bacterium KM106-2]
MKKFKYLVFALIAVLAVGIFGTMAYRVYADTDDNKICNGVYIESVDISGMTKEQAQNAIDKYVKELNDKTLTVDVDGNKVEATFKELGFGVADNDYAEKALEVGKTGNLIKRYKELKDIEKKNLVYNLEFTFDKKLVEEFVNTKCGKYNIEAQNATMTRRNGSFVITQEKNGREIVVDDTIKKINSSISSKWDKKDVSVSAVMNNSVPKYKKADLEECNDVLGTFSTTYHDSSANRANNLANGAKLINGAIIYPGETFSAYAYLNPFTAENGYTTAGAYNQGKVVDSIGGGVCQVSTTLYNAALHAELEIAERAPHSMAVSYVRPAMDAAIAGTYKDLKLKNNQETPVYIEAYTSGRTITFTIYGKETRASNRTIKFESETVQTIQPGKEVVTKDKTLPEGYRKVTQSAHVGYKANFYKIVYVDGVQVERIKLNSSSYAAEPAYVTVGTKKKEEEKKDEDSDNKDKDKDNDKDKDEDDDKKENSTPKPSATARPTATPTVTPTPVPTQQSDQSQDGQ